MYVYRLVTATTQVGHCGQIWIVWAQLKDMFDTKMIHNPYMIQDLCSYRLPK